MRLNVFGWIVSLIFIAVSILYFDWCKVWVILKQANLFFLLLLFGIYIFDFYLRAYRWKLLLSPIKKAVSFPKLFYSYNIAYFANIFLPARTGEFVRVFITGREENISKRTIGGTIILERIFDVMGMAVLILSVFLFLNAKELYAHIVLGIRTIAIILISGIIAMAALIISLNRHSYFAKKFPILRKAIELLDPVWKGFQSVNRLRLLLSIAILSIFMWVLNTFIVYLYMRTLSFKATFFDGAIILACQLVGEFIPSAPSSIGTFHASTVIGCKLVGLSADQGMALGFLNHTYDMLLRIITGAVSMHILGFDFRKGLKNVRHADA